MGTLHVERKRDGAAIFRRIQIEVDGRIAAKIARGKSVAIDLEPGEHSVRARLDWQTSSALRLDLEEGSTLLLKVEYPMSALGKLARGTDTAIRIALDGEGPAPSEQAR